MFEFISDLIAFASKIGSIRQMQGNANYTGITVSDGKGKIYDIYISVKEDKDA